MKKRSVKKTRKDSNMRSLILTSINRGTHEIQLHHHFKIGDCVTGKINDQENLGIIIDMYSLQKEKKDQDHSNCFIVAYQLRKNTKSKISPFKNIREFYITSNVIVMSFFDADGVVSFIDIPPNDIQGSLKKEFLRNYNVDFLEVNMKRPIYFSLNAVFDTVCTPSLLKEEKQNYIIEDRDVYVPIHHDIMKDDKSQLEKFTTFVLEDKHSPFWTIVKLYLFNPLFQETSRVRKRNSIDSGRVSWESIIVKLFAYFDINKDQKEVYEEVCKDEYFFAREKEPGTDKYQYMYYIDIKYGEMEYLLKILLEFMYFVRKESFYYRVINFLILKNLAFDCNKNIKFKKYYKISKPEKEMAEEDLNSETAKTNEEEEEEIIPPEEIDENGNIKDLIVSEHSSSQTSVTQQYKDEETEKSEGEFKDDYETSVSGESEICKSLGSKSSEEELTDVSDSEVSGLDKPLPLKRSVAISGKPIKKTKSAKRLRTELKEDDKQSINIDDDLPLNILIDENEKLSDQDFQNLMTDIKEEDFWSLENNNKN